MIYQRTTALQVVSTDTRRDTPATLRAAAGRPARTAVEDGTDATRIVFIIFTFVLLLGLYQRKKNAASG